MIAPLTAPARKGSTYAAILGASVICTLLGMSAVVVLRTQMERVAYTTDTVKAQLLARSGVEMGIQWINDRPDSWRQSDSPILLNRKVFDAGTISVVLDDEDGDLNDGDSDPVTVAAEGIHGQSRRVMSVRLEAEQGPMSCLDSALTTGSALYLPPGTRVEGNSHLFSNAAVYAFAATVSCEVQSAGTVTGSTYSGGVKTHQPPRELPGSDAIETWKARATEISISALPWEDGAREIDGRLISPLHNPFTGDTNSEGIYSIDCQGQDVVVRDSRLVGTLILLDPGNGSIIEGANLLEPARGNSPVLIVQGNLTIAGENVMLAEASVGTNFNPPGVPYEGVSDNTTVSLYSSVIRGLVFVDGILILDGTHSRFDGVVLADSVLINGNLQLLLDQDDRYYEDPPEGFRVIERMVPEPGSWASSAP